MRSRERELTQHLERLHTDIVHASFEPSLLPLDCEEIKVSDASQKEENRTTHGERTRAVQFPSLAVWPSEPGAQACRFH